MVPKRQQQWWSSLTQRVGNNGRTRANGENQDLEEAAVTVVAPRGAATDTETTPALNPENDSNHAELQEGEQTQEQGQGQHGETQDSSSTRCIKKPQLSRFHWAILFLFIVSLIAVAVIIPVMLVKNRNDSSPSQQQAQSSLDTVYLQEIRAILVPTELWTVSNAPQLRATELMALQQPQIPTNSSRLFQRYALLTMYFSNGGQRWGELNPMEHECDWFVVKCTTLQKVVELNMGNQLDMTGTLVSELGFLTLLTVADFEMNRLEGTIPTTLYELTNLVILKLSSNRFTSTIDSSIGNLTKLTSLRLNDNFFEGTLPSSLAFLTSLSRIAVDANLFSGNALFNAMPKWTNLEYFDVSDTSVSGTIPTEIGLLTNLIEFEAFRSQLTGTLPSQLGLLDKLNSFAIYDSGLSGTLPTTLGNLESLEYLLLAHTLLTGTIPTEIGKLTSLVSLSLSNNMLNGTIPTQLGLLTNLQELYLTYNDLTGTIPSELGNLSKLQRLTLFRAQLSGDMPLEICALIENGALKRLENSCEMVACDCCTRCINPTTVGTGDG